MPDSTRQSSLPFEDRRSKILSGSDLDCLVAVNYLFLRRSLMKKVFSGIAPLGVSQASMMQLYRQGPNMAMYLDRHLIRVLPADFRKANYARITELAKKAGLAVHLCACKNSDITSSRCNLAGPPPSLLPDLFSSRS